MIDLSALAQKEVINGYKARFIHTGNVTLAFWEVEKDALLPEHSHVHEQITQVLEGKYKLTIEGETRIYEKGLVAIIPSHALHSGRALTDCKLMDIFSPVREDYK